jgi:hypothetical protein
MSPQVQKRAWRGGWRDVLVHDNGRSMRSHAEVQPALHSPTASEMLCDSLRYELLRLQSRQYRVHVLRPRDDDQGGQCGIVKSAYRNPAQSSFGTGHVQCNLIKGIEIQGEEGTQSIKYRSLNLSNVHTLMGDKCSRDGESRVPHAK